MSFGYAISKGICVFLILKMNWRIRNCCLIFLCVLMFKGKTMNTTQLLNEIEQLPPEAQHQIEDFNFMPNINIYTV